MLSATGTFLERNSLAKRPKRSGTRRDSSICRLEYLEVLTEFKFGMMKSVILALGQAIDRGFKVLQMLGTREEWCRCLNVVIDHKCNKASKCNTKWPQMHKGPQTNFY